MSNNVIATGKRTAKAFPYQKIRKIVLIAAAAIALFGLIQSMVNAGTIISNHTCDRYCTRWGCDYENGVIGYGLELFFYSGKFVLPALVLACGFGYCGFMKKRREGYELNVTEENVDVLYNDGKCVNIPMCSIFTVEKKRNNNLEIVTSENAYLFGNMEGVDEVYAAILEQMPKISIQGPANNEQVLSKGYPPAIKPLLLILAIILAVCALCTGLAVESFGAILVMLLPALIVFLLYRVAKTPYVVVTDKRVFYVSDFGRKLSIPMNKINVVVTFPWFRQLHICAPVGRIHLFWVRNTADLYDIITAVINEKQ